MILEKKIEIRQFSLLFTNVVHTIYRYSFDIELCEINSRRILHGLNFDLGTPDLHFLTQQKIELISANQFRSGFGFAAPKYPKF